MKNQGFRNLCKSFSVNKYAKFFGAVPFIIVLIAMIVIISIGATSGGNYSAGVGIGVDFEGGTRLTVTLTDEAAKNYNDTLNEITQKIESFNVNVEEARRQNSDDVVEIVFRYKNISKDDDEINDLNARIKDAVESMPGADIVRPESIGATAASDLLSKAAIALSVSVVIILVYIIIRFTLMSGFAAIIALLHDVVIMFCLTVICRVQINSSYVAAMITIIAYSINNTIIIFDRCREYLKPLKGQNNIDYKGIGDMSVRETMTRSIYTTLTTMVTVIFLAILGGETMREFCVPIILGLIAGLYSSVFLATPLWGAMSISFDKTIAKYKKRHAVAYEKKEGEDEEVVFTDLENAPIKPVEPKPQKQKANAYARHYQNRKNTTFKKKK